MIPSVTAVDDSRTKEERAKNDVRAALFYLNKMAKKDLSTFSGRDKYLMKRHRKSVIRFEKIQLNQ